MMHVKVGMDGDLPMRIQEPGTYEWWYFDAIDESQELAITIIFFDGMPMSPYWLDALPNADSREYSGYAVSLYRRGKKLAGFVHHTEHNEIITHQDEMHIRMGGLTFRKSGNSYTIGIDTDYPDSVNSIHGELTFHNTDEQKHTYEDGKGNHCWRLIAPQCKVEGNLSLSQYDDIYSEWTFEGHGYHDCNSGTDALYADYDDWYWGRCQIDNDQTIIYYHYPMSHENEELSIGFIADSVHGIKKIEQCRIQLENVKLTSSLMRIASLINIQGTIDGEELNIRISHAHALEFGPFYYRYLIESETNQYPHNNHGIAEYFNAKRLKSRLVRTMIKTPMHRV
jgi:carotenoid 1,2-hydratase